MLITFLDAVVASEGGQCIVIYATLANFALGGGGVNIFISKKPLFLKCPHLRKKKKNCKKKKIVVTSMAKYIVALHILSTIYAGTHGT